MVVFSLHSAALANKKFENASRNRWTKYYRGNLNSSDSYFGGGFFETGLASGDFVWDNYAPDWSWYNPSAGSATIYEIIHDNFEVTFQGEVTVGPQAGGYYKFSGVGPGVELNVANLQLIETSYNSSNPGIQFDRVGKNGVYHVSNRVTVPFADAYQSFDTKGTGYFNHDVGGSLGPAGYSTQAGNNLGFDVGGSFLIGVRMGFTISFR